MAKLLRKYSKKPLISVIIPTRNRPDTLASCLAALAHHKSRRIEIVVQDNCSEPVTRHVVEAAQRRDNRIRYSRSRVMTSQRHNFELGLAAATGDYLSIIGDDDGYCLGSLDWLVDRLTKKPADAVRWHLIHYAWPTLSTDGEGFARIYTSKCYGGWRYGSAKEIAANTIAATNIGSWDNVLVYHGMISRRVYDRIRTKSNGVFFSYLMPDVYAHNLIAFHCDEILQVENPVSIYGTSGHSAGVSWSRVMEKKSKNAVQGQKWIEENQQDPLAVGADWQSDIRTIRYHDLRGLEVAKSLGLLPEEVVIDRKIFAQAIIAEIEKQPWTIGPWFTTHPKSELDAKLFRKVRTHFARLAKKKVIPPESRFEPTYPDTLLRVRHLDLGLTDNIEGAMLGLHFLFSDGSPIYDVELRAGPAHSSFQHGTRSVAAEAISRAPSILRKVLGKILPDRYIPHLANGEIAPSDRQIGVAKRIVEIRRTFGGDSPA